MAATARYSWWRERQHWLDPIRISSPGGCRPNRLPPVGIAEFACNDAPGPGDGHKIVGFLCRWLIADECHVLNIAVHPDSRRLGIGGVLITEAISEARTNGASVVTLEVRRTNLPARQLYRKFDFEERRLRRHYYGPGEDAIIMELRFD